MTAKVIVDKLWNCCNILRDDGLSYGDYLEQLTYLLFLKMVHEQHELGLPRLVPEGDDWPSLLERNATDTKSGAGQYFTPRALISAMVDVMQPGPDMRITDPACGTGGFFLAAYEYILGHHRNLDPDQSRHLRSGLFTGWEIVDNTARLCAMNLLLHGIESPDLGDFVACYRPGKRSKREESECFRRFTYDELIARDKASLDIFWLRDESLEDTDNLPSPGVIAAEIVEDLEAALAEFAELAESLQGLGVSAGDE